MGGYPCEVECAWVHMQAALPRRPCGLWEAVPTCAYVNGRLHVCVTLSERLWLSIWHWEIVRGCEKDIVRFGVTIIGRLSVNRRLFSSLSLSCGGGGCQGP